MWGRIASGQNFCVVKGRRGCESECHSAGSGVYIVTYKFLAELYVKCVCERVSEFEQEVYRT